jgi:hypothetical protein
LILVVYRGASNILEVLPDPDAIINASNFTSPKELAEYPNCSLTSHFHFDVLNLPLHVVGE